MYLTPPSLPLVAVFFLMTAIAAAEGRSDGQVVFAWGPRKVLIMRAEMLVLLAPMTIETLYRAE